MAKETSNEILAETLEEIREENGGKLRPQDVVDAARAEKSPLHHYFDWDDTHAAEQHRLWQSRQLIKRVRIVIADDGLRRLKYFSMRVTEEPRDSYYLPGEVLARDKANFAQAKAVLLKQLHGVQRGLRDLESYTSDSDDPSNRIEMISLARQAFDALNAALVRIQ